MKVEIVKDRVNRLLDRREIEFRVTHEEGGTPPRKAVVEELSKLLREAKDRILILNYRAIPGFRISRGEAFVFMDGADLSQVEPKLRRLIGNG